MPVDCVLAGCALAVRVQGAVVVEDRHQRQDQEALAARVPQCAEQQQVMAPGAERAAVEESVNRAEGRG